MCYAIFCPTLNKDLNNNENNNNDNNNNNNNNNNDSSNNNNNDNNNNNNFRETRKYWVKVQRGIISSHGERDPL